MSTSRETTRLYYQYGKKYKRYLLPPVFLTVFVTITGEIIPPVIVAAILDKLAEDSVEFSGFIPLLGLFVLMAFIVTELMVRFRDLLLSRGEAKVMRDIKQDIFEDMVSRDMSFHANNFGGALVAKASRFTSGFEGIYDTSIYRLITTLTISIFTFGYLAVTLHVVAPVLFIITVIVGYVMFLLSKKRSKLSRKRAKLETETTAQLADTVTNVAAVKSFGREKYENKRFSKTATRLERATIKAWDYQNIPIDLFSSWSISLIYTLALAAAVYSVVNGLVSIGAVFLTVTLVGNIVGKIWDINRVFRTIEKAYSDSYEMTKILTKPHSINDRGDAKKANFRHGRLSISDITFSYSDHGKDQDLFTNFSLDIPSGQKVGLVGPSGSGKSSLTKLLLRYNEVQNGEIQIDDTNINYVTQSSLRQSIAYVPQDPLLFHRSILENIKYGRLDASEEEVKAAAKKARADIFIEDLPYRYETLVGERGVKLSGGQRQRVALARAILKNAPLFVLDEATSSLDSESEQYIQDALEQTMKGRTSIVIAHRLSTIQKLDRIVVMAEGEIVEDGTHNELLELGGLYASLWSHQSGGFLEE